MNAPHPLPRQPVGQPQTQGRDDDDNQINLLEYWDIIVDNRWLVAAIAGAVVTMGAAYALFARPVYQANLLVQVEDSSGGASSMLGEAAAMFQVKTAATAEMEILRSRMVIGQAVDNSLLYVDAKPRYLPFIGSWFAKRSNELSNPGFLGMGGYVTGTERIEIAQFDVPTSLEGSAFRVTAGENGQYVLTHPELDEKLAGKVGERLTQNTAKGPVTLLVSALEGKPSAQFNLTRRSRISSIQGLQQQLKLAEKGRQSGVIEATLQSTEPRQLTLVLNEIGRQYVRQNIERKAAEAQKTLAFLDVQLPQFKKQLEQAEESYNKFRNEKGTVALDEEAKLVLTRTADLQAKLLEAQQRRRDLAAKFTAQHPSIATLDDQIAAWNREIAILNDKVRSMPSVQQDTLRLERDVKVNNELYQQLRNNALQLQLVREGKIGNVRVIDEAVLPEVPVQPKRPLILALSLVLGLLGGAAVAIARNAFFRGVRSAQEIEAHTGLSVYSTIPLSPEQAKLARKVADRQPGMHVLTRLLPEDPSVESLRSLRTALQFAMLDAPDNRIIITGATPAVGKSFVSTNLAAVLATAGMRVLLIDADLRKGYLNHYFGLPRERGLSDILAGQIEAAEAVHRQVLPDFDLITTGALPPNPAELLMRGTLARALEALSPNYDVVIVDTAPVLVAADTMSVAPHAGTVLLVARAEQTQLGELNESTKRLAQAGKSVSGVLFNGLDLTRRHTGKYGYRYGGYKYRHYSYEAAQ